ncbi:hypothetical protein F3Y22_tig00112114pilonHSYRG00195 [Hibiscus syriacus]|uniref:Uncharacterized protein n=1 Tax=Hibiscus syriacus TaxID=106335 RepID=A0A6A2X710_HIBSY|nr:hypothetical protein F3Y22_tig00112114pilonHSYRG00195 [Hibiscus syriacus]
MAENFSIVIDPSTLEERAREAARIGVIEAFSGVEANRVCNGVAGVEAIIGQEAEPRRVESPSPCFKNGNVEAAFSLFEFSKDLARVKGKNGYTPFHLAVTMGDSVDHLRLLRRILKDCPECIHDVTNQNDTALHLAAQENNLKAFHVLRWSLLSSDCSPSRIKKLLNFKNMNGDTVIHIAANKKQQKAVDTKQDRHKIEEFEQLTAMEILEQAALRVVFFKQTRKTTRLPPWKSTRVPENRVPNNSREYGKGFIRCRIIVLSTEKFLWFFIPNIGAFYISFIVTCFILISNLPVFFWATIVVALSMLCFAS